MIYLNKHAGTPGTLSYAGAEKQPPAQRHRCEWETTDA